MQWLIDAKKQDTKLPSILRQAVRLFVEKGIEGTTTKDIAEAAGVAEGTLYRHFKGKEEMAYHVFVTHLEAFTQELLRVADAEDKPKEKLRALIRCYFSFFETDRILFEYILLSEHRELRHYPESKKHPLHAVQAVLEDGISRHRLPRQDVTLACAYVIGMVHRVSVFRSYGRITKSLTEYVDRVTEACWRVIASA